jgi:hypothetical protein
MGFKLITTLVVIGSECTGSCKSIYHMTTTTTVTLENSDSTYMYSLTGSKSVQVVLSFVYLCFAIGEPIIKTTRDLEQAFNYI